MLPKLLLIIDLETTGLNSETDRVIELGAILYSVPHHCVLQQLSTLFPVIDNAAEHINQISSNASQAISDFQWAIAQFQIWAQQADYLIAHNAKFDSQWFGYGVLPYIDKPWLCTYRDFIWKNNSKPTSLVTTCINHGIEVSKAHRALTDCQMIAELFDRTAAQEGELDKLLQKAIARSKEETITVIALVDYSDRYLAKEQNFRWDGNQKIWSKVLKASDYNQECKNYPFKIKVVNAS